ncbi:aquaporin family protein [Emticicia sp. CRIBPO]|uniref:MIP/aquaporin family protein n=1 Tax=Emticicia sp. CRIBPO TaxID=2683258 RepID=UPI0014137670|nr:MIP/aquaporin family protein [Emticicia sp. CRIBPO]NBA87363.1 aquaporin family protein [Emticicia sp. CRIBPO]
MQTSTFMGELMGTLVLILLGDGVVANVLLKGTKGHNGGLIAITTAWAFAVAMGVFVAQKFGSEAAHLNPALTIAFAFQSGDWSNVFPFISAQMTGAFLGATIVWLFYFPHWQVTEDKGLKLGVFCTAPAIRHIPSNLFGEIIGTIVLFVGVSSIYGETGSGLAPYLVGVLVWVIGLSLGGTTGYAINPARDLGPRLAHAILPIAGKGGNDWAYSWIPVAGPIIGGVIGTLFF